MCFAGECTWFGSQHQQPRQPFERHSCRVGLDNRSFSASFCTAPLCQHHLLDFCIPVQLSLSPLVPFLMMAELDHHGPKSFIVTAAVKSSPGIVLCMRLLQVSQHLGVALCHSAPSALPFLGLSHESRVSSIFTLLTSIRLWNWTRNSSVFPLGADAKSLAVAASNLVNHAAFQYFCAYKGQSTRSNLEP